MDIPVVINMEEYGLSRSHDIIIDNDQLSQVDDIKKGPWTVEEDSLLFNHVSAHGEGRWNALARHAGLKRTGKSCRLRWLNYLRPSVRRGNITLQEQLLILELHSRWGNRWSKIAQCLPGRTDNEIKNYWRTRVQKQAKQLNCDVTSTQFQHAMRHLWIPRLIERIQAGQPDPTHPTRSDDPNNSTDSTASDLTTENYCSDPTTTSTGWAGENGSELHGADAFLSGGDSLENWWSEEDLSFFQQHLLD